MIANAGQRCQGFPWPSTEAVENISVGSLHGWNR